MGERAESPWPAKLPFELPEVPPRYGSPEGIRLQAEFAKLPPRNLRIATKEETEAFLAERALKEEAAAGKAGAGKAEAAGAAGRRAAKVSGRSMAVDDQQRRSRRALGAAPAEQAEPRVEPKVAAEVDRGLQPAADRREQPAPGRVSRRGVLGG
jgi:hypothetical protein